MQLTDDAARDLEEVCDYIDQHEAPGWADNVLEQIDRSLGSHSEHPHRGSYPGELRDIGIQEYREIFFKSCRIIYRVVGDNVHVLVITDGRRDMRALLERRLLQA